MQRRRCRNRSCPLTCLRSLTATDAATASATATATAAAAVWQVKEAGKNKSIGQFEIVGKAWDASLGGFAFDVRLAELLADRCVTTCPPLPPPGGMPRPPVTCFVGDNAYHIIS